LAVDAVVDRARQFISPAIFAEPMKKTILVPISDDGWAPEYRCGEFAVVEVSNREPEDGAMTCIRLDSGDLKMARLRCWNKSQVETICDRDEEATYWSMVYGRSPTFGWCQDDDCFTREGHWQFSDGPADDEYLRSKIIGRVIGVLGANDRALNWKGEAQ
jgi:hypothetical protein